jgi:two-component system KDP operon response regulator KdpE
LNALPQGKVLIIDDETSIRRALHTTLGTLGFDIAEATTGEQGLALLAADNYDAVLST